MPSSCREEEACQEKMDESLSSHVEHKPVHASGEWNRIGLVVAGFITSMKKQFFILHVFCNHSET